MSDNFFFIWLVYKVWWTDALSWYLFFWTFWVDLSKNSVFLLRVQSSFAHNTTSCAQVEQVLLLICFEFCRFRILELIFYSKNARQFFFENICCYVKQEKKCNLKKKNLKTKKKNIYIYIYIYIIWFHKKMESSQNSNIIF